MIYAVSKTRITCKGICFDGNGQLAAGVGNYPSLLPCVHLSECVDVDFPKNKFIGFYNCGLLGNVITNGKFRSNYLDRGIAATFINHGIGISGEFTSIDIDDSDCLYCQIAINATNSGHGETEYADGALLLVSTGKPLQLATTCWSTVIFATTPINQATYPRTHRKALRTGHPTRLFPTTPVMGASAMALKTVARIPS